MPKGGSMTNVIEYEEDGIEIRVSCFNCLFWGDDPKAIFDSSKGTSLLCTETSSVVYSTHTDRDHKCEKWCDMPHGRTVPCR